MEVSMKRNRLITSVLFILAMMTFIAPGFSKDESVGSMWIASPPSIDGMNTEWTKASLTSYKKTAVDYAFMNDSENLYVLFIFRNPKYLSSINWTGLTMWVSPQGEKKKELGINLLRKQISADEYIAFMEKQVGQEMPEDRKAQVRQNKAYWMFEQRLINKNAADYDADVQPPVYAGAQFRSNVLDKALLYEVAISFPKLAEIAPELGVEPGKSVSVNFEWGGATKEYKESLARGIGQNTTKAQDQQAGGLTGERGGGGLGSAENDSVRLASMRRQLQQVKQYDFWIDLNLVRNE
jgi:hypothetical protein